MIIDANGIGFIKICEGYKDTAYRDQAGIWTIGYGTTYIGSRKVRFNDTCTVEQATKWLGADLVDTEDFVTDIVEAKIDQNQFNALVSLAYNIGFGGFSSSTLLDKLNDNKKIVEDYFTRWCKVTIKGKKVVSQGLLNRRKKEWLLFNGKLKSLRAPDW